MQDVVIQRTHIVQEAHQRREAALEDVVALGIQQLRPVGNQIGQPGFDLRILVQEIGQEAHHFQNVRFFARHRVAHKYPQRFLDIEVGQLVAVRTPKPKLLVKTQQAGGEVFAGVVCLLVGLAAHVQNERFFAVAVFVEKLVRVVKQDALGVNLAGSGYTCAALVFRGQRQLGQLKGGQFFQAAGFKQHLGPFFLHVLFGSCHREPLGHSLAKGGRVFKSKTAAHQRITPAHPCPRCCARAPMAFVHQHQVVALKGFHRHRFLAHLIAQLVDVDDFYGAARRGLCFVEMLRKTKARQMQLIQMLARQTLVGREQDDLVGVVVALAGLKVVQILVNVHMQQQRLAAAGGVPERDLVQVIRFKITEWLRTVLSAVTHHLPVQAIKQRLPLVEIPVEVNLREQQRQVLKVLHLQLMAFELVALGRDGLPMHDNVQVVTP